MTKRDLWGRLLLSVALMTVLVSPLIFDLNGTHIFNPAWPPHARFHTTVLMFISAGISLMGFWLLWRRTSEFRTHLFLAMLIPVLAWGSFFLALLLPGTGVEDVPGVVPRVAGLPANIFVALAVVLLSIVAWLMSATAQGASEAGPGRRSVTAS